MLIRQLFKACFSLLRSPRNKSGPPAGRNKDPAPEPGPSCVILNSKAVILRRGSSLVALLCGRNIEA